MQRPSGWRAQPLAARYDVVIVGDGALAAGVAWSLASLDPGRRVAVVAPRLMAESCHPADMARLHALRTPAALSPLVTRAAVRYRAWAEALGIEPPRVRGGHVAMATTVDWRLALSTAAAAVPSCRAVTEAERSELVAGHDRQRCLAGWHEPLATSMEVGSLVFRLAECAAAAGVDLVDGAAIQRVARRGDHYRVGTAVGTTDAAVVIDVDPALAVARAAGLRGTVWAPTHQRLTTDAMAPLLATSLSVDDVAVSQRFTGEVDLVAPVRNPVADTGLAAAASGVAAVLAALPMLGSASVLTRDSHREAVAIDGLPLIGPVADGLWACGGLGRHHLELLPLMAEALATAALTGSLDGALQPFVPQRHRSTRPTVLSSAPRLSCPNCGPRRRAQFVLVGGRLVHRHGCGRAVGADPAADTEEPRELPVDAPAVGSWPVSSTSEPAESSASPPATPPAGSPEVDGLVQPFSFTHIAPRSGWSPPPALDGDDRGAAVAAAAALSAPHGVRP